MPSDLTIVVADLGPGGAQRVVTTLANAWAKEGRRLTIVTLADDASPFFPLDARIQRQSLGLVAESRSLLGALMANGRRVLALRQAIRRSRAPVVVSFVGATNVLSVLAAIGLGAKLVICERNDPSKQSLGQLWDWMRRRLYRHADLVTANSREACEWLRHHVPADRLRLLPNPLAVPSCAENTGGDGRTVLAVGRLSHQKGYDILLTAFAQSQARRAGWRLAIVGDGELRDRLRAQADELGLGDQVEWRGRSNDVTAHHLGAEIFVMASRHEGMPNAVLEAMALGRPVIVTDGCGGALEFVSDGKSGLVVPVEDVASLGAAIDRLASDAELRQGLAAAGRQAVDALRVERVLPIWDDVVRVAGTGAAAVPGQGNKVFGLSLPQDRAR